DMSSRRRAPVSVARNDWKAIPVPELGMWTPNLTVSVVLPYYQRSRELTLTLAGLASQTYPHHLLQVLVVDDGSPTDPPRIPKGLPFDVDVLTQEDRGYGLARARNLGAKSAEGDVVVFLDCDMVPERQHIEAHARWHHEATWLATVGFRYHVEFGDATSEQVAQAVTDGSLSGLFEGKEVDRPEWIEAHMDRTGDLLGPHEDFYLMMSGGNLGIDPELYHEAGGTDESFEMWGGEDNEFAYRALQLGAVAIPERQAIAWHQGEGHEPTSDELAALESQKPKLWNLVPDTSVRVRIPGRSYLRPYLTIFVDSRDRPRQEVAITANSILASDFADFVLGIGIDSTDPDIGWFGESFQPEARVVFVRDEAELETLHPFSPVRMSLQAGFAINADTLDLLVSHVGGPGVGAFHLTLPQTPPSEAMAEVRLTRALSRARLLGVENVDETIGELFGERWASGASLGVWRIGSEEHPEARIRQRRRPSKAVSSTAELEAVKTQLQVLQARRALKLADAFGSIFGARSLAQLKLGIRSLFRVIRRAPTAVTMDGEGASSID
ncbi:MAG: glycosyltransferase, partial [Acidimicrobiia bacterium]